ncbi:MAG: winged helix-turn-helix transcriptional regulator [Pyrinomonadaceae bacterium]
MKKNNRHIDIREMVESIIGCKWSLTVIEMIRNGTNRPGLMQRNVDGLTTKVLNERLRKLVRFGIIEKTSFPEVPPRVEYKFTEFGIGFLEILDVIERIEEKFPKK